MQIYVARHGQTEWNVLCKVCGRTDIPLTDIGLEQAAQLAEETAKYDIDLIIASPMLRAQQTAGAIAQRCGLEILTDDRLIEQDYGACEGLDRFDPMFLNCKRNFPTRYPGGESMLDLACRVYGFLDELPMRCPGKNILLVCHGGVMRAIRTYFEDMTNEAYFNYSADNAKLEVYQYGLGRSVSWI